MQRDHMAVPGLRQAKRIRQSVNATRVLLNHAPQHVCFDLKVHVFCNDSSHDFVGARKDRHAANP